MQSISKAPNEPRNTQSHFCLGSMHTTWRGSDWRMEEDDEEVEGCCWKQSRPPSWKTRCTTSSSMLGREGEPRDRQQPETAKGCGIPTNPPTQMPTPARFAFGFVKMKGISNKLINREFRLTDMDSMTYGICFVCLYVDAFLMLLSFLAYYTCNIHSPSRSLCCSTNFGVQEKLLFYYYYIFWLFMVYGHRGTFQVLLFYLFIYFQNFLVGFKLFLSKALSPSSQGIEKKRSQNNIK